MLALIDVVMPVFLVTSAGYLCVRLGYFSDSHIDGLNRFTQNFAIPLLLFRATMTLDLGAVFDWRLLLSFYVGATTSFFLGLIGARMIFGRRPGEAVAIGFGALFSNSVILGIPIIDRAFGGDVLAATYAIIAIHAPFCYLLGITVMEISRADGRGPLATLRAISTTMGRNALMIGIVAGFAVNFSGLDLPSTLREAVDLVIAAALPTALFGLGGVLHRYVLTEALGEAAMISALSLLVHPSIAFVLAQWVFGLPPVFVQAAVLTAAMAPGVNTYIFASIYKRGEGTAAATVLMATALSVLTISGWLVILNSL